MLYGARGPHFYARISALGAKNPMSTLEVLFHSLEEQGWAVSDTLVPRAWQQAMLAQSQQLWQDGHFHQAHIGRSASDSLNPNIRGDAICWIDPEAQQGGQPFFAWMAQLRLLLNERYYLGLRSQEFHFARYEAGCGYRKHLDQHRNSGHRKISVVLYLNPQWDAADGGELCLYLPDNDMQETQRILPQPARLVVFRSDQIPHEVLPCAQTRWSLSGWLRSDEALV